MKQWRATCRPIGGEARILPCVLDPLLGGASRGRSKRFLDRSAGSSFPRSTPASFYGTSVPRLLATGFSLLRSFNEAPATYRDRPLRVNLVIRTLCRSCLYFVRRSVDTSIAPNGRPPFDELIRAPLVSSASLASSSSARD